MTDLLEIDDLRIRFEGAPGHAVDGVSITVPAGRRVGIIGESGSGKSVTAMSILRLNDERIMSYSDDSAIRYRGEDLLTAPASRLRQVRGAEISMIFQDPMSILEIGE